MLREGEGGVDDKNSLSLSVNISASPSWRNLGGTTCSIGVGVGVGVGGGLGWMMPSVSCVSPLTSSTSILGEGGEEGRCPTTKKKGDHFFFYLSAPYIIYNPRYYIYVLSC